MSLTNIRLIFLREVRDQLRDRRTLFTILVLPMLLYPLMGMSIFQVQQFVKEHASKVRLIGTAGLPEHPALIKDGQLAASRSERDANMLRLEIIPQTDKGADELERQSRRDIRVGLCDAVVVFPADFGERLAALRRARNDDEKETQSDEDLPRPDVIANTASDRSKVAKYRIELALDEWRRQMFADNLRTANLPSAAAKLFEIREIDVADAVVRRAALWSKILPFVLMVWALTGAFYPAIDLCAGEKERGTLETLLSSPAARGEIVCGKLLTVMTFSMATSLLNLISMTATGAFILTRLQALGAGARPLEIGPPPLLALTWLVLALIPISALFSALALAIAAFARSSKEGQYYLVPLLMISLPLMMLPMMPAAELDLGYALIPLSGLMLLLRSLIEGQYWEAFRYSVPVIGVTAACCLLAIRWAIDQFNNESVLFRESERLDLGVWVRHLMRDRQDMPTIGEALLCGVLLLVIRFFFSLSVSSPTTWRGLATTTVIMQIALIAAPAALMAIMLTRRPLKTLLITRPPLLMSLAAGALAVLLHPTLLWISEVIRQIYPLHPQALESLASINNLFVSAPFWEALLVVAVVPAICEELAFRGFILSGLRRMGHTWGAIALASVFFGIAHGIIQQSLSACVVGLVIGLLAVRTGSLLPCVIYHFTHNGLTLLLGRLSIADIQAIPGLGLLFVPGTEAGQLEYAKPVAIGGAAAALILLWWFQKTPYHHSAEERFQEALEQQPATVPASSMA